MIYIELLHIGANIDCFLAITKFASFFPERWNEQD